MAITETASAAPAAAVLERRQYDLRPGTADAFWAAQVEWNRGETARPVVRRSLCYFQSISGPAEQIVHLYAFDTLDHWRDAYTQVYANHPPAYFEAVRRFFHQQQNAIFRASPIPSLVPDLFGGTLPRVIDAVAAKGLDPAALCVVEETIDLAPGMLASFWDAYRTYLDRAPGLALHQLVFVTCSLIGVQHRVLTYRWFDGVDAAGAYRDETARNAAWIAFADTIAPMVRHSHETWLRPSPLPWLRTLFQTPDWVAMESYRHALGQ